MAYIRGTLVWASWPDMWIQSNATLVFSVQSRTICLSLKSGVFQWSIIATRKVTGSFRIGSPVALKLSLTGISEVPASPSPRAVAATATMSISSAPRIILGAAVFTSVLLEVDEVIMPYRGLPLQ